MPVELLLAVPVMIIATICVLLAQPQKSRVIAKLEAARPYAIGELPEGEPGRLIAPARVLSKVLTAPLTGRPCLYFIAQVDEQLGRAGWSPVIREHDGVPFQMQDASGRVLVDPDGADLALDFDACATSGFLQNATPIEEEFLARFGESSRGLFFNRRLRYREAIIGVDEVVAVYGEGVREPDPDAPPSAEYRGEPVTRLRFASTREHPLAISDNPAAVRVA